VLICVDSHGGFCVWRKKCIVFLRTQCHAISGSKRFSGFCCLALFLVYIPSRACLMMSHRSCLSRVSHHVMMSSFCCHASHVTFFCILRSPFLAKSSKVLSHRRRQGPDDRLINGRWKCFIRLLSVPKRIHSLAFACSPSRSIQYLH
jgi:hypothetical protein